MSERGELERIFNQAALRRSRLGPGRRLSRRQVFERASRQGRRHVGVDGLVDSELGQILLVDLVRREVLANGELVDPANDGVLGVLLTGQSVAPVPFVRFILFLVLVDIAFGSVGRSNNQSLGTSKQKPFDQYRPDELAWDSLPVEANRMSTVSRTEAGLVSSFLNSSDFRKHNLRNLSKLLKINNQIKLLKQY